MTTALQAGIYAIQGAEGARDRIELWESMLGAVMRIKPGTYRVTAEQPFRVVLLTEVARSMDRKIIRFRTIEANIRRKRGFPTLLDLGVGNLFTRSDEPELTPVHIVNDARYAVWARRAGAVGLTDHLSLCGRFVQHLQAAGWKVESDVLHSQQLRPVEVTNATGERFILAGKMAPLLRQPAIFPSTGSDFLVVAKSDEVAKRAARGLQGAFAALLGEHNAPLLPRLRTGRKVCRDCVNLILLDEQLDLNQSSAWLEGLRTEEESGTRFKLSKVSSLGQPYPARNIAFDLFHIAGGRAWRALEPQLPFCALDAGHDPEGRRSRWVKVETDADNAIVSVLARHTERAEHIPAGVISSLWPTQAAATLCRDGRLTQERSAVETRAARERRPLIEVKKSPKPVIWSMRDGRAVPSALGDAVIDSHDEILLQTTTPSAEEYVHPVRLAIQGGDPLQLATNFLHQHAVPALSLFHFPRLPGALYYADLVSKFTSDGWPKVIGRGFRVPLVVPEPSPRSKAC